VVFFLWCFFLCFCGVVFVLSFVVLVLLLVCGCDLFLFLHTRGGGVYCVIVVQWHCNNVGNAGGRVITRGLICALKPRRRESLVKAKPPPGI